MDVAFVGRMDVQRDGPERRIARLLEDDGLLDMGKTQAAIVARGMRCQQAGSTRFPDQLRAQLLARAVRGLARVLS